MVVSLGWHEGTTPLVQWHVCEGVVGGLVVSFENAKNLLDVCLATWGQVMNVCHDLPYTM